MEFILLWDLGDAAFSPYGHSGSWLLVTPDSELRSAAPISFGVLGGQNVQPLVPHKPSVYNLPLSGCDMQFHPRFFSICQLCRIHGGSLGTCSPNWLLHSMCPWVCFWKMAGSGFRPGSEVPHSS